MEIDLEAIVTGYQESRYALRAALDTRIAALDGAGLPSSELTKLAAYIPAEPEP